MSCSTLQWKTVKYNAMQCVYIELLVVPVADDYAGGLEEGTAVLKIKDPAGRDDRRPADRKRRLPGVTYVLSLRAAPP